MVALDRKLLVTTLIAALLFLWPLLVYGRPAYFQDSAAYYKGGRVAVTFAVDKLGLGESTPRAAPAATASVGSGGGTGQPAAQAPQQVRGGARSVAYSILAYVLGAPRQQMWLLAAAQALAAGFVSAVALLLLGGTFRTNVAKMAVLAVATPMAFVVCFIMPDIFAGIVILVITLLATAYRSLSRGVRLTGILIGIAGITFHASHLPLGLGVTAFAVLLLFVRLHRSAVPAGQWAAVFAPFILAASLTIALNSVAFGGASLTGKRFPLTLARSVAEGPARWYLDRNCAHLKYAICEVYPHGVPTTINTFLWGKNGVKERATPEQMDRIRNEESEVVLAAARAYPLQEIGLLSLHFGRQLVSFQPGIGLDARIVTDPGQNPVVAHATYDPKWVNLVGALSIVSVIASLLLLLFRWRTMPQLRPLVVLVLFGILLNAAICVYFSGVTDRYQSRVIWLVPLLALMALPRQDRPTGAAQVESQA